MGTQNKNDDSSTQFHKQIEQIAKDVADVKISVATINTSCKFCRKTIGDLETTVYGNGKDGLKTRVDRLERSATAKSRFFWQAATVAGWLFTAACLVYSTFCKQPLATNTGDHTPYHQSSPAKSSAAIPPNLSVTTWPNSKHSVAMFVLNFPGVSKPWMRNTKSDFAN